MVKKVKDTFGQVLNKQKIIFKLYDELGREHSSHRRDKFSEANH